MIVMLMSPGKSTPSFQVWRPVSVSISRAKRVVKT